MSAVTTTDALPSTAPWEWSLCRARATRLAASALPRWLVVTAGRVWLTQGPQSGAGLHAAGVWLAAGERHALPAGSEWVAEGAPEARVAVLEAPLAAGPPTVRARWLARAAGELTVSLKRLAVSRFAQWNAKGFPTFGTFGQRSRGAKLVGVQSHQPQAIGKAKHLGADDTSCRSRRFGFLP